MTDKPLAGKVALITGGAQRIGAHIARSLHTEGMNLVIHYHNSKSPAHVLQKELQMKRPDSVVLVGGDLLKNGVLHNLVFETTEAFGHLDVLINNASTFYPTPLAEATEREWDDLMGTNLKAPFFLAQRAADALVAREGCVINIADIYGDRPLKNHPIYSTAKAGLIMLTKSLAREMGPKVRVNAIAPGVILWPEKDLDDMAKRRIVTNTPLKRLGSLEDISRAVIFLIRDSDFITGQIIGIDGGRGVVI